MIGGAALLRAFAYTSSATQTRAVIFGRTQCLVAENSCETLLGFGSSAAMLSPRLAAADSYPSRPIKLLVAQAPGGAGDVTARAVGE